MSVVHKTLEDFTFDFNGEVGPDDVKATVKPFPRLKRLVLSLWRLAQPESTYERLVSMLRSTLWELQLDTHITMAQAKRLAEALKNKKCAALRCLILSSGAFPEKVHDIMRSSLPENCQITID